MNKHIKLFVGILVAVLVLLIVATVSFSLNVSKNSESHTDSSVNANGNVIFQGDEDLYGMRDASGNTIIDAKWEQLRFLDTEYLSAVTDTAGGRRVGVLDSSGNIVAPFVYQDVQVLGSSYYMATFSGNDKIVIYDSTFRVAETMTADTCSLKEDVLTLTKGNDQFQFAVNDYGLTLQSVALSRSFGEQSFTATLEHADAALLTPQEWIHTADLLQSLLTMMSTGDFSGLDKLTDQSHEEAILSAVSQPGQSLTQTEPDILLHAETSDQQEPILTWQASVSLQTSESDSARKAMSVTMAKSQQEVWVITELQLS